jgi:formylglycine-generating enzyme required for sulfatase activity
MKEERGHQRQSGLHEQIAPVDFKPLESSGNRQWLQLSPAHCAIAFALAFFVSAGWFVLSARSIYFDVQPLLSDSPITSEISIEGALNLQVGPRYLVLPGNIEVTVNSPGYYDFMGKLIVGEEQSQSFLINLTPLPGKLNISTSELQNVQVLVDEREVAVAPVKLLEINAGPHEITLNKARYESYTTSIDIEGRNVTQTLEVQLLPAWADITINTIPAGATVSIDGEELGTTPLVTSLLEGERALLIKLAAYKAVTQKIDVTARQRQTLPTITLVPADGLVLLESNPSDAGVTLNGEYKGQTPLELSLPPTTVHQLRFFKNGYQDARQELRTQPAGESSVTVSLKPITTEVKVQLQPNDATLYVNGQNMGTGSRSLQMLASSQTIEVRRDGYVSYTTNFTPRPGLNQLLEIKLKSIEQQRIDSIPPTLTNAAGQELKLIYPGTFEMGSSRRESGRQANEVLRKVELTQPFYLSLKEVTNEQFALFDKEHSSGIVEGQTLANLEQPVVRVSWEQAAAFCNWLSAQEGLQPFYDIEDGAVSGFHPESTGYRLPSEAEWEWVARINDNPDKPLRYGWGDAAPPPPERFGNFADKNTASFLGRVLLDYNDGYTLTAPVGSFAPNSHGFYDMSGNAAEWVHDYYGAGGFSGSQAERDPLGPTTGTYHVIKGSSWAHGTVTELRLAFRDYNNIPRDDVGFRVARYLGRP